MQFIQFISDDRHLGQVLLVLTIRGSILGENTNPFGVVTGICQIKYVMLRAVTAPGERSSFILFCHHPLRLYPLVMIQRHAVSGVR